MLAQCSSPEAQFVPSCRNTTIPSAVTTKKKSLGIKSEPRAVTAGAQTRAPATRRPAPRLTSHSQHRVDAGGHCNDGTPLQNAFLELWRRWETCEACGQIPALLQHLSATFNSWQLFPCAECLFLCCTMERTALSCAKTRNTECGDTAALSASPGH